MLERGFKLTNCYFLRAPHVPPTSQYTQGISENPPNRIQNMARESRAVFWQLQRENFLAQTCMLSFCLDNALELTGRGPHTTKKGP